SRQDAPSPTSSVGSVSFNGRIKRKASDDRFEPYFNPKRRAVSPSLVGSPPVVTSVLSLSNSNGNNDNDDVAPAQQQNSKTNLSCILANYTNDSITDHIPPSSGIRILQCCRVWNTIFSLTTKADWKSEVATVSQGNVSENTKLWLFSNIKAESKRKTIGSNEYKNNSTSNKCPFLKINSISPTHDSTIVNLCISTAFVTRVGLGLEFDGLYSADYTQIEETSKNLNTTSMTLFTKKNFIKRIAGTLEMGNIKRFYEQFLFFIIKPLGISSFPAKKLLLVSRAI
ncbi:9467_t:CDS:2, partial [Entrophospora sp. SA101]